jgi:hypothetical protein
MEKRFSKIMLSILFLSLLTLIIVMMPFAKATGDLSVSPTQGPVGEGLTVTATVSGFVQSDSIDFIFGPNLYLGSVVVSADGSGSVNFGIPQVNPGTYTITATGSAEGDTATAQFTVSPPTTSQTQPTAKPSATASPTGTTSQTTTFGPTRVPVTFVNVAPAGGGGFWSPITIAVTAVVVAFAIFMTAVYVMRSGKPKPLPYKEGSALEPRPLGPAPPTYNQQPPYSSPGMGQSSPYGQRPSYSSSRMGQSSPYGQRPSYSSSRMGQQSTYGQRMITCPNCKRAVRDDQNVCPYCSKRLK